MSSKLIPIIETAATTTETGTAQRKSPPEYERRLASTHKDRVRVHCGDCLHFAGPANPELGEVNCSKMGMLSIKIAPACYVADTAALRTLGVSALATLGSILSSATPKQLRIVHGLMGNAASLERAGFTFLEEVYFQVGQSDALEGMYKGYVLARLPDNYVSVTGSSMLHGITRTVTAVLHKSSLMSVKKFNSKVKRMVAQGKLHLPPQKNADEPSYVVPTMDTSLEELEARAKRDNAKPKRKGRNTKPQERTTGLNIEPARRGRKRVEQEEDTPPKEDGFLFRIG